MSPINATVWTIYTTKEVADLLDYDTAYLIRVAKDLQDKGRLSKDAFRASGKKCYLFTEKGVEQLLFQLSAKRPYRVLSEEGKQTPESEEVSWTSPQEWGVIPDEPYVVLETPSAYQAFQKALPDKIAFVDLVNTQLTRGETFFSPKDRPANGSYARLWNKARDGKVYRIHQEEGSRTLIPASLCEIEALSRYLLDGTELLKIIEPLRPLEKGTYRNQQGKDYFETEIGYLNAAY